MAELQRHSTSRLGMAVFLASEAMLFGALLCALLVLRSLHPEEFASQSRALDLTLGTINTALLLSSSCCVAMAVQWRERERARGPALLLALAGLLGLAFLAIKAVEYRAEYLEGIMPSAPTQKPFAQPGDRLFMDAYFAATGLHALHVAIGVFMLWLLAVRLWLPRAPSPDTVTNVGLYWHLVDVIWVFLFPLLYLSR